MSEHRYTADEIRKVADQPTYCGDDCEVHLQPELVPMLIQAADAEEELERALKNEKALELRVDYWRRNHNSIKARLDAVVKECDNPHWQSWFNRECYAKVMSFKNAILRAARGEGGAE